MSSNLTDPSPRFLLTDTRPHLLNLTFVAEWNDVLSCCLVSKLHLLFVQFGCLLPGLNNEPVFETFCTRTSVESDSTPLHILTELPSTTIDSLHLYETSELLLPVLLYSGYQDIVKAHGWLHFCVLD